MYVCAGLGEHTLHAQAGLYLLCCLILLVPPITNLQQHWYEEPLGSV